MLFRSQSDGQPQKTESSVVHRTVFVIADGDATRLGMEEREFLENGDTLVRETVHHLVKCGCGGLTCFSYGSIKAPEARCPTCDSWVCESCHRGPKGSPAPRCAVCFSPTCAKCARTAKGVLLCSKHFEPFREEHEESVFESEEEDVER